jgi:hypothetical protein
MEIVDLCSDSDSDGDADADAEPLPTPPRLPKKRVELSQAGKAEGDGDGDGEEMFSGVKWRTATKAATTEIAGGDVDVMEQGEEEMKEENSVADGEAEALVLPQDAEGYVEMSLPLPPLEGLKPAETGPVALQLEDQKNMPTFTPLPPHPPSAISDSIIIEISDPDSFFTFPSTTTPQTPPALSDTVKPTLHIETIQTKTGNKKRKLIGPFVLEDDDNDEPPSPPGDEGYRSLDSGGSSKTATNDGSGCSSDPSSPESSGSSTTRIRRNSVEGMEGMVQRRKREEDRCAEASRRMREEALARRRKRGADADADADCYEPPVGLSREFLEDGVGGQERVGSKSSTPVGECTVASPDTARSRTNPNLVSSSSNGRLAGRRDKDDDDDDLFNDNTLSTGTIEAQLNFAQRYITTKYDDDDGAPPSPKDLSRSCKPSFTPASSGMETQADRAADSGSHSGCDDRNIPPPNSIPRHERQPVNGKGNITVTSGIEHYDQEQPEKYRRRVDREERREGRKWPEKIQFENRGRGTLDGTRSDGAPLDVVDGAKGKNESKLLAPKEPLRAATNVNGGLARLVQRKDEGHHDHLDHAKDLDNSPQADLPAGNQKHDDHAINENIWTKNGSLRERKRDIEGLMSALTESAKCWCIAFDGLSVPMQQHMQRQLRELRTNFARAILKGYSSKEGAQKRMPGIKKSMTDRSTKYQLDRPCKWSPTQKEIEEKLIELIGRERYQRGQKLLKNVRTEYEEWKKNQEKRSHRKRACPGVYRNGVGRLKPTVPQDKSYEDVEEFELDFEESDPYEGLNLTREKRAAWQREDAKIEQLRKVHAKFENVAEPTSTKQVHFADQAIWEDDSAQRPTLESEESDEDEGETAPSFGRGVNYDSTVPWRHGPPAEASERNTVGGKGLLSELREENETARSSLVPEKGPIARKKLPSQDKALETIQGRRDPSPVERNNVGGKSVSELTQQEPQEHSKTRTKSPDIEDSQHGARDVQSEADDSVPEDEDVDETYDGAHIPQHDIVADYENFDDNQDAASVLLGRHIDVKSAMRQMTRVTSDIVASVSRKYRQLRIIWDTDDFQLASQTIILPTGGECRVRMGKSWTPATDWPGRQRDSVKIVPQVFYILHETKKTSLRPYQDSEGDAGDEEPFGPEDFEDPDALAEKERDMCFSSRHCANEIAKNRLIAFISRYNTADDVEGTVGVTELAEYMEQIRHDTVCFNQEKKYWMENMEGWKGKVEIKIWVEEMIADMPHI